MIGCSLAARAAKKLEDDAGIPSSTIDRLLAGINRHTTTLDDTTVLVVDEAAMVGTRTLARLLTYAEHGGTKVVLVGDPCQLPEIEAGDTFAGLQHRLGGRHLRDNRLRRARGNVRRSPNSEPGTLTAPSTTTSTTTASTKPRPIGRPATCSSTRG